MSDKMQKLSIAELEARAALLTKQDMRDEANNVMAYVELRRMLVINAERDLIVAQAELRLDRLESICSGLQYDREEARRELTALRRDHEALKRVAAELRERQDIIAAVVDTGISKIEQMAARAEALAEDVSDRD